MESNRDIPADAHTRHVFYAGGEYVASEDGNARSLQGQIYVEHLTPIGKPLNKYPIVFIPGGGRSSVDFLTKPDGNPGWASFFLARGHECYLIDPAFRGRSPWSPSRNSKYHVFPAELVAKAWTTTTTTTSPLYSAQSQWPGTGQPGDPSFDGMYASTFPSLDDIVLQQSTTQKSCAALLDRIARPVILVGHSLGAPVAWLVADVRPRLVKAVVAVEPAGPPFAGLGASGPRAVLSAYGVSDAPITFVPPVVDTSVDFVLTRVQGNGEKGQKEVLLQVGDDDDKPPRQLVNLVDVDVLVITGEASRHATYDWGTAAFLRQAGVKEVKHIMLGDMGIRGNRHMMMMERNSDQIAGLVGGWVDELG
ncbi:Alpha/Beta hydrolase protein [Podospora didyma]|uniref:Alpha/Beta hydrolase protein n=1 Tax=Podospora didyma TaxID=330526 RepID=A0AAE0TVL6_9PEZI|nr:Alpha/Beta hydrolase protein [Podospora didyma]